MAAIPKVVVARRITPDIEMIWFDKKNHIEVAEWLQSQGVQAQILFPKIGRSQVLIVNTHHIDLADDVPGVYFRPNGQRVTLEEYVTDWAQVRVIR